MKTGSSKGTHTIEDNVNHPLYALIPVIRQDLSIPAGRPEAARVMGGDHDTRE